MNGFKKVFVYELKKTYLFFLVFVGLTFIAFAVESFFYVSEDFLGAYAICDVVNMYILYAFCLAAAILFAYRTFACRRMYEKVRVRREVVFLAGMSVSAVYTVAFVFAELAFGSAALAIASARFPGQDAVAYEAMRFAFAFQGKNSDYFLFPFAVAMTVAVICSVTEFAASLVFSSARLPVKILFAAVGAGMLVLVFTLGLYAAVGYTIGAKDVFGTSVPVGKAAYDSYLTNTGGVMTQLMYNGARHKAEPVIIMCAVCWNIRSLPMLAIWFLTVGAFFVSVRAADIGTNPAYLYGKRKRRDINEG